MNVANFTTKFNKTSEVYVVEEKITMPLSGTYSANLAHDNINEDSLQIYTGPNLTGTRITTYTLSVNAATPWKRSITVETNEGLIYISYECTGDQVEAEDINLLQDEIKKTQTFANAIAEDVQGSSKGFTWNRLMGITDAYAITIDTQPEDLTVAVGATAEFSCSATGEDLVYRWQYCNAGSSTWSDFADGDQDSVEFIAASSHNNRQVRCIISDVHANVEITNSALLTVISS